MKKVAIIDYDICNLFSVENACKYVGLDAEITSDYKKIEKADGVILPGVGAFRDAMNNLKKHDLVHVIKNVVEKNTPFLGICLGLQLLFSESEEFGKTKGMGILEGTVVKFKPKDINIKMCVPQIGWNKIIKKKDVYLLEEIQNKSYMYFVHSFYVRPENEDIIATKTNYEGIMFCSSISKKNIFASQFHPEKSGTEGLKIYSKWAKMINGGINE